MVSLSQIKVGSYSSYEGPYYYGKHHWELPKNHDFLDEAFYVTSKTEGTLESINMYDRAICTVGSIQWADFAPQFYVMKLLNYVAENHSDPEFINKTLQTALEISNASFKKNSSGERRFFLKDKEVTTQAMQRELYFGGASGRKGQWTKIQLAHAKTWAAGLATVFENKEAQDLQAKFTKNRLMSFVSSYARTSLFNADDPTFKKANPKHVSLLQAAYISFAVNSPLWASNALKHADKATHIKKWSLEYVANVLNELVYNKGISIYPARYRAIRPTLISLYGTSLPKNPAELLKIIDDMFYNASDGSIKNIKHVQLKLNELGINVGNADGIIGDKTKTGINIFKKKNNLSDDHVLDHDTILALSKAKTQQVESKPINESTHHVVTDDIVIPLDVTDKEHIVIQKEKEIQEVKKDESQSIIIKNKKQNIWNTILFILNQILTFLFKKSNDSK